MHLRTSRQAGRAKRDAAGNLTNPGPTGAYDAENHLVSAAGVNYTYDGEGNRVMKSNGTIYWYGAGAEPLIESDLSNNWLNTYFFFNGQRIGRYNPANAVEWYFGDHLGNARIVWSQYGSDESDYYPFGGERIINSDSGADNHYKFTGKERDPESGLDNFGARYNSSQFGRFMSPDDPFVGWDQYDPQSLNTYTYVHDNPLNMVDDDGHQALPGGSCTSLWCLLSEAFHAIFGGGGGHEDVTTHMITNNPDFSSPANNGMLGQKIPGQNNLTLQDFSIGSRQAMVEGFKFTRDSEISITLMFIFPEADIEEIVLSSERMASPQITMGAKTIAKKLGHALSEGVRSAFEGNPVEQERAAALIRDIMRHPVRVDRLGRDTEVYNAAGQGVRFENGTNMFITFVEIAKAMPLP